MLYTIVFANSAVLSCYEGKEVHKFTINGRNTKSMIEDVELNDVLEEDLGELNGDHCGESGQLLK